MGIIPTIVKNNSIHQPDLFISCNRLIISDVFGRMRIPRVISERIKVGIPGIISIVKPISISIRPAVRPIIILNIRKYLLSLLQDRPLNLMKSFKDFIIQ
jgi:hypothetical protein